MNSKFPGELEPLEWDPPLVSIPPLLPQQAIVSRDAPAASLSPKPPLPDHDAYLTSKGSAADRDLLETTAGDDIFTFRFNRVRERGRGWVMAGFEVAAARRRRGP